MSYRRTQEIPQHKVLKFIKNTSKNLEVLIFSVPLQKVIWNYSKLKIGDDIMAKKFKCLVCGYVHEGETAPEECPLCFVGSEDFKEITEDEE